MLEEFKNHATRAESVKAIEDKLFEMYKNPDLNIKLKELEERGGAYYSDAACACISAIYNNKRQIMVVSTENRGAVSCLPDDAIVEVSSLISRSGAEPIAFGELKSHG